MKVKRFEKIETDSYCVEFNENVPDWKWSEIEQKPIIAGYINEREQAQSSLSTCLDVILDKFLNGGDTLDSNMKYTKTQFEDELNELTRINEFKNEIIEKYNLNPETNINEINNYLLNNLNKIKEKENLKDAKSKEDVLQEKQEIISKNGEQDTQI